MNERDLDAVAALEASLQVFRGRAAILPTRWKAATASVAPGGDLIGFFGRRR